MKRSYVVAQGFLPYTTTLQTHQVEAVKTRYFDLQCVVNMFFPLVQGLETPPTKFIHIFPSFLWDVQYQINIHDKWDKLCYSR